MAENAVKKIDYSIMSKIKCKECGQPLKQNKVIKGHRLCYVCFKISQGKTEVYKLKGDKYIRIDFKAIQRANKIKNNIELKIKDFG